MPWPWSQECTLLYWASVQFSSVAQSCLTLCKPMQDAKLPCASPTPRAYSNPCPSSQWCHSTISFSVVPFSFCLQSFLASGSFPVSQFFASGGQSIGVSASASVLPMNSQDWFHLGWTSWISLLSKELSRVFSKTTVQKTIALTIWTSRYPYLSYDKSEYQDFSGCPGVRTQC